MTKYIFDHVGDGTLKGSAITALARGIDGAWASAPLNLSGNVADQQTFSVGDDTYEIHQVNTNTTMTLAEALTDDPVPGEVSRLVTSGPLDLSKGRVLRIGSEYMIVLFTSVPTQMHVVRGALGSSVGAHSTGANVFRGAQAHGAGNLPIGVAGTLTAAVAGPLIAAAVSWWNTGYSDSLGRGRGISVENALKVAVTLDGNSPVFSADGAAGIENSDTMANANLRDFAGGQVRGARVASDVTRVPIATEVTDGKMYFYLPFVPDLVQVSVHSAAVGTVKVWDGAVTIVGQMVILDNSGSTDWAVTDRVRVRASAAA